MSHIQNLNELLARIREDRVACWRDSSQPGFRALAAHRFGNWVRSLPRAPRLVLFPVYLFAHRWFRNHYGINLYYTTKVGRRVVIANQGNVSIAKDAEIGDDCVIRHNVTIGGVSGARPDGPIIGSGVEVGAGAVIIGRIRIGDGARIGPNAVVMTNVPAGAIAVAPATRILEPRRATHNNSLRPAMQEHEP